MARSRGAADPCRCVCSIRRSAIEAARRNPRRPARPLPLAAGAACRRKAEGPERIAPEWWRSQASEVRWDPEGRCRRALTRDYFRIEDESGRRFWLYREGLWRRETASAPLVPARPVRVRIMRPASPQTTRESRQSHRLSRNRRHHEFLLPARRVASGGDGGAGWRHWGWRDRHCRPQHAGRRGAGACGLANGTGHPASRHALELARHRRAARFHGWHARYPRLSAGPRRLWPPLPPAHARQAPRVEGQTAISARGSACEMAGRRGSLRLRRPISTSRRCPRRLARSTALRRPGAPGPRPPCGLARRHHAPWRGGPRGGSQRLAAIAGQAGAPLVATNDVLYHAPDRRPLQDVLTCIREKCTIDDAGLPARSQCRAAPEAAARDGAAVPPRARCASSATIEIARRLHASRSTSCATNIPTSRCRRARRRNRISSDLTWEGAARRFPARHPREGARRRCEKELALIEELDYAPYFLTVHDIVHYARGAGHPLPGARLGRQLRRLLLPRHHQCRSRPRSTSCSSASSRAERQRAARHRRRFRA